MSRAHSALPIATIAVLVCVIALPVVGQQPTPIIDREVKPSALERRQRLNPGRRATFGRRESQVGDRVEQAISLEMRLNTSLRQGNELIEKKRTTMLSKQRRLVTTTDVDQGRASAVQVRYLVASKRMEAADAAAGYTEEPAAADAPTAPQRVQGKTYHCRRDGGEDGKLIITDAAGNIPPSDEYEIVAQNMDMVGRSNPLAEFLGGRTVALGETLKLPKDVARRLFNLGERYGEVTRFDLTLQEAPRDDDPSCAVFMARVEAASNDASQMRLEVEGPLVVELATCRAVRTSLAGPIGFSETRGSYSTAHQLMGTGRLTMSIASTYRDVRR